MTVAVVTGLRDEADCIAAAPAGLVVACAGPGPAAAEAAARRLLDLGAEGLVSFGVAGALTGAARPGTLLLPTAVVAADATRYPVATAWRARLAARLPEALGGPLAGVDAALLDVAAKRALQAASGAVAIDMESHALARLAAARGVPFVVLRAVADPADEAVPALALQGMSADGRTRALPVLCGLLRRPGDLPALLRLSGHMRRATAALRRAAPQLAALVEEGEEAS